MWLSLILVYIFHFPHRAEQSEEVETNLRVRNTSGIEGTFNSVHWTAQAVSDLEASARNGTVDTLCIIDIVVSACRS